MRQSQRYHEPPRHYRGHRHHPRRCSSAGSTLLGFGPLGVGVGGGWAISTPEQKAAAFPVAERFAIDSGIPRERAPQDGGYWRSCNDARAAGTAPIYRGVAEYREGIYGDNDGIACEPYR